MIPSYLISEFSQCLYLSTALATHNGETMFGRQRERRVSESCLLAERPRNEETDTPHTSSFRTPLLAPLPNQKRIEWGVWAFNGQRATS